MFLSRESIYPFSPLFFRERTLFARGDRSSFLFFLLSLLSLLLPFVLTGGQRDILLLFCLLARISLRIPWVLGMHLDDLEFGKHGVHVRFRADNENGARAKAGFGRERFVHLYLSMILWANFSPGSGPEIPLNVSLLLRFGGQVTTKKWTTWLFANEKGSHLWQVSPSSCSNGVAQTVPEAFLPRRCRGSPPVLLPVQRLPPPTTAFPTPGAGCCFTATPSQGHAGGGEAGCGRARLGLDLRKAGAAAFPQENVPLADGSAYAGGREESRRLIKHPWSGVGSVGVLPSGSCQGRGASDAERFD